MKTELFDVLREHIVEGCVDWKCDPDDRVHFSEHLAEMVLEVLEESA